MIKCPHCGEVFDESEIVPILAYQGGYQNFMKIEPDLYVNPCPYCTLLLDDNVYDEEGYVCLECGEFYTELTPIKGYCRKCVEKQSE